MVSADGRGLVSQAGAVLLWETMRVTGLGRGLSTGLDRWRAPRATSPPREELSRNSVHLDEAGPRPRGTSSQGRRGELTECQPGATHWSRRGVLHPERQRVRRRIVWMHVRRPSAREPTSAMAVNEPGLGSSADGKGEEGVDRSFERAGTPVYLGE